MRNRLSPLVAFALMLMLAAPALAQKGDTQDNQQQGSGKGATVTKTFELTINGDAPADRVFAAFYGTVDQMAADQEAGFILFCGQPADAGEATQTVSSEDCVGGGRTYSASVDFEQGTELLFLFSTAVEGNEEATAETFFTNIDLENIENSDPETLNTDFTNSAFFNFGGGKGAGGDQQDDQQGGAGDVQDNQQGGAGGNAQGDTQDNQQSGAGDTEDDQQDTPTLPATGAGGLAGGASMLPYGVAGLAILMAGGYTRRRR